jgi:small multidrug resistance family-3 protein
MAVIVRSLSLFVLAGLCEIGGGYLVWLWLREGKGLLIGVLGAVVLILYGVIPTFQPSHFGRVYAAYGGIFVVLSIIWGWLIAQEAPDAFDLLGGNDLPNRRLRHHVLAKSLKVARKGWPRRGTFNASLRLASKNSVTDTAAKSKATWLLG